MSRYLQVAVGDGRYLLDVEHVREVAESLPQGSDVAVWQGQDAPVIDLRELFQATDRRAGACVLLSQIGGAVARLVVDRVEGLVEISDREFHVLPPIGAAGALIDAVWGGRAETPPMLRLRGERALAESGADRG